mmetsp:Transcript_27049/g.37281  ORF Transcript_27049/g.37281 Transcript_27049/m.37281 type:complete len:191 (+) Transcript_27049:13-585(+)
MTTIDISDSPTVHSNERSFLASEDEGEYEISDSDCYTVDSESASAMDLSSSAANKENSSGFIDLTIGDDENDDIDEYPADDLNDKNLYWNNNVATIFDDDPPLSFPHLSQHFWSAKTLKQKVGIDFSDFILGGDGSSIKRKKLETMYDKRRALRVNKSAKKKAATEVLKNSGKKIKSKNFGFKHFKKKKS